MFAVSELVVTAVTGAPSFGVGVSGNTTQFGGPLGTSAGRPDRVLFADQYRHHGDQQQLHGGTVRIAINYMLCNMPAL